MKNKIKLAKDYLRSHAQYSNFTLMYYYPEKEVRYFFHGRMVRTISFTYAELVETIKYSAV